MFKPRDIHKFTQGNGQFYKVLTSSGKDNQKYFDSEASLM